jgi:pimeloyl-ACP methyl ester carboxylesterase
VLLHGQGGWAGMWLPVAADLVRTHRVIAPDLPGLGASIAARFAVAHPDRLSRLVLVDAGSLARFRPAPGVLVALVRFIARPTERTQQGFLRQVAVDPARARALLGADAQAYGLELARTPRDPWSPASGRLCQVLGGRGRVRRPLHISRHVV